MKTNAIIVLDGYGLNEDSKGNAIKAAKTPYLDYLFKNRPNCTLKCSGLDVGLPEGQMGNSEVGHLNIGAGRVVFQDITAIDNAIDNGSFFANDELKAAMENAKDKALHLCGLVSDGGVHSVLRHLFALLKMAHEYKIKNVYVHAVTDGRDSAPDSAISYVATVERECAKYGARLATITGRFYYMDRDKRWDRVERGYNCVFCGNGVRFDSSGEAIEKSYESGILDEFIEPCVIGGYKGMGYGDSLVFFNFRADRAREISAAATEPLFNEFKRDYKKPFYVGMTEYDTALKNVRVAFKPKDIRDTLGEYLSQNGLKQTRIAETEKYAHVTFFFNGGVEKANEGEERILIPSPKVKTYDTVPQMSAYEVARAALDVIGQTDVLIVNLANCDMVGHTGIFDATVRAVEAVDECLKTIVDAIEKNGGFALILSDHGNAEVMLEGNSPMTAHTTNLVPLIYAGGKDIQLRNGSLCDVAPTFLFLCGLKKPDAMTGNSLAID